jgi:hypothetical protein
LQQLYSLAERMKPRSFLNFFKKDPWEEQLKLVFETTRSGMTTHAIAHQTTVNGRNHTIAISRMQLIAQFLLQPLNLGDPLHELEDDHLEKNPELVKADSILLQKK